MGRGGPVIWVILFWVGMGALFYGLGRFLVWSQRD